MTYLQIKKDHLELKIYLQPGAKKSGYAGIFDDELKIRIQAPATEGKANKGLITYMSKSLSVPKSLISIKKGLQSRHKTVRIETNNPEIEKKIQYMGTHHE